MKIKLIIILFSISCLFFPAGLMEAEAVPIPINLIKKIIHEAIQLTEKAPAKAPTANLAPRGAGKLCQQNQELCIGNDEIMYKELSFDKYGIKSLQTPSSWEASLQEGPCHDGLCGDILSFTDDFWLTVIYSDTVNEIGTAHSLESILNPKRDFGSLKKELEEIMRGGWFFRGGSNFQIIESEGNADRQMVKYTMYVRELPGLDRQVEQGKVVFIGEDSFAYIFWFHNKQSEFALNADVYDHIENTFVTSHQSYWQNVWVLIAIIIAIIAFVAWRWNQWDGIVWNKDRVRKRTSSKKS